MNVQQALGTITAWRGIFPPASRTPLVLRGRGLFAARLIFLAFAALAFWLDATNLWRTWATDGVGMFASGLSPQQLRAALAGTWLTPGSYLAVSATAQLLQKLTYYIAALLLFQPLRGGLQRAANRLLYGERDEPYAVISRLGRQLEGTLAPDAILPAIVGTVAGALRLPYAAIALGGAADRTVAAAIGTPTPNPLRLPLAYQGEAVGELLLAPRAPGEDFSPADRRLLADLARQAGVAARAVRLADEARLLAADLQASRERLVTAREEERRRLRRDLHDGLGPRLASLTLRVETARDRLAHDPLADQLLADLAGRMEEAVADIRRVVYALRPPALDDLGLVGALRQTAESYHPGATGIVVEAPDRLPPLPAAVEVAAYRIAQEALTNVARHARASTCTVRIALDPVAQRVNVDIEDDGRGFGPKRRAGVGLHSMHERAAELGGTCTVEPRPGGGLHVRASLPCHAPTTIGQEEPA